jgi:hypothetical protein
MRACIEVPTPPARVGTSTRGLDPGSSVESSLRHPPISLQGEGGRRVSVERPDFPDEAMGPRRAPERGGGGVPVSDLRDLPDAIRVDQCPGCKTPNVLVTYARAQRGTSTIHETPRAAKCSNERCFCFDPSVDKSRVAVRPHRRPHHPSPSRMYR